MKKVGLVLAGSLVLAFAAVAPGALGAHAAKAGVQVTVTVKTLSKTLVNKVVSTEGGWITKGGAPTGKCPGSSAAGALDAATHGKWTAKYYPSLKDVFIKSIEGVKPPGKDFWSISVNGKPASTGACEIKLRAHEKLLFKIAK
jgi:hypothetical protein